jgi:hypothetical protein
VGYFGTQEVGRILLLESYSRHSTTITAALGGVGAEWHFSVATSPVNTTVKLGVITPPDAHGLFRVSPAGWQTLSDESHPIIITSDLWLEGGYFALKVTFANGRRSRLHRIPGRGERATARRHR